MRSIHRAILGFSVVATMFGPPAWAEQLLPERRAILMPDTDLPGGDLRQIFDTTLQSCVAACSTDTACSAFTYNQKSRACFPKTDAAGEAAPFMGALSGRIIPVPADAIATAQTRRDALKAMSDDDIAAARRQAQSFAAETQPGYDPDPQTAAQQAEATGDLQVAIRLTSQMLAVDDSAAHWTDLARLTLQASGESDGAAKAAAVNGYLRAGDDAQAAQALRWLAVSWERGNRGRDALAALKLAATLAPNDSVVTEELAASQERNGFRVSDSGPSGDTTPRLCATLSDQLDPTVDYTAFVRTEIKGAVEATGDQLCLTGVTWGQEARMTLRSGLPSATGETLARDVDVAGYIRDRAPAVRFPGRGYVLPVGGDQGLAMVTVNTDRVDIKLLKLSDRNLIRVMDERLFAKPLDGWRADYFSGSLAHEIWAGTADVAKPTGQDALNRDLTTRLAIPAAAGPLEPGIYIVEASLPGHDTDETGVATQWFVMSDFGISTLSGTDGLTVAVRALADASAKAGAEVALISAANDVLGRAVTDADGVARFPAGLMRGQSGAAPALVTVTQWKDGADGQRVPADMAFLSLTDPEFDLSDRGVEGRPPAPPIDVFLTTDRGAYRAGETVNATILTRDPEVKALAGLPLTAVIRRPDGVEQARLSPHDAGAGGAVLSWTLPGTAQRGSWRIEVRAEADGPALAETRVLVEDFRPERIDFSPTLPDGPARMGAALPVDLTARWLFGAPAANLPVEASLRTARATTLPGWDGFVFGKHDDDFAPETVTLPAGMTDAQGHYTATATLPDTATQGGRPIDATLSIAISEGAGRPVERNVTRLALPDSAVIGIKPMFEGGAVDENSPARFQIVAIGPDLKPVKQSVHWVLNRVETEYQWYSLDGSWNWEPTTRRTQVTEGVIEASDQPVEVSAPTEWGEYELVAAPANGPTGAASTLFSAGWGVAANANTETPDRLKVALDKPAYRSGDTARVTVEAAAPGIGLVSVLSNRVVALKTVALTQGVNNISLPVTDDWGAGVYVTVSAIRPVGGITPDDHRPIRTLGLAHAAIDPGAKRLNATLTLPDRARPRADLPVKLAVEGASSTVYATVAVVDQGILNLTGFASPNPAGHYFDQRRLGVGLRDLYGRLILPSGAPDGALREGGDAQMATNKEAPPPTEKLMAWFSGPVTLNADGTTELNVPIADFNGEVRVMAVVWTDSAVGQAEAKATLTDPIVMTVTAPQFLAPGDIAQVGLRLTHVDGPTGDVAITVKDMGTIGDITLSPGALSGPVTLTDKGEAQVTFPITAGEGVGAARLALSASLPGGAVVTKDITVPILMGEPEITRQDEITLSPGASATLPPALTAGLMPGATVTLATGDFARLDVAAQIARLDRYPYGCTEQLASTAMPLLYLPNLAKMTGGDGGGTTKSVQGAIDQILTRQASDGGFGLWSPESGDLWLDAYTTDFLSRARAAGHQVPDKAFRAAILHLQSAVSSSIDPRAADPSETAALAYAVAVLARERAATIGDLRYYADTAAEGFATPMASANLGAALAAYGDQPRADRMFRQAMAQIETERTKRPDWSFRSDYGTRLRDEAAVLALAAEAGSAVVNRSAMVGDIARANAAAAARGGVTSTQEAVWSVLAANAVGAQSNGITINGTAMPGAVTSLALPGTDVVANSGAAPVDLRVTAMGQPMDTPRAWGNGYRITRSYYDLDGKALDPTLIPAGQRMVAVIEVSPQGDGGGRLIVNDPLPAGFEIDNPHLLQSGDVSSLDWVEGQTDPDMAQFLADRFTAALTWNQPEPFKLAYVLRAVTPGQFRLPAASVEDMYRPERRAWTDGGRVTVAP